MKINSLYINILIGLNVAFFILNSICAGYALAVDDYAKGAFCALVALINIIAASNLKATKDKLNELNNS